jgi:hypothetical protein
VRRDGHYGDGSVIAALVATGLHIVVRKRGYALLEHPLVQAAIAHEPVATITTQESHVTYELFDRPTVPLDGEISPVRLILTRRAWKGEPMSVGKVLGKWVYEQFVTTLPSAGCLAADVLDWCGAFEGTLADEDREGDPDRWCSLTACGQEFWQIVWQMVWQWVWNLRLALHAGCMDAPVRSLEWAPPSAAPAQFVATPVPHKEPTSGPLDHWNGHARTPGDWAQKRFRCKTMGRCVAQQESTSARPKRAKRMPLPSASFLWPAMQTARPVLFLSSSSRVPGTHRQRQAGTTGERRATSTAHFGAAGAASTDCRGSAFVEGCGWTPVAARLDGALAPANGDAGRLTRQLVATSLSPPACRHQLVPLVPLVPLVRLAPTDV